MNSSPNAIVRPKQVDLALQILYTSLVISTIKSIIVLPQLNIGEMQMMVVIGIIVGALFAIFINYMIGRGKNWARMISSGLIVLSVLLFSGEIIEGLKTEPLMSMIDMIVIVMNLLATALLFYKESSLWFKASSNSHAQNSELG